MDDGHETGVRLREGGGACLRKLWLLVVLVPVMNDGRGSKGERGGWGGRRVES